MTDHHDVRHMERGDGVFDGRRGAVPVSVGLIGRDEVCDVAVDEELARVRFEDGGYVHPAVAAGDDHAARALAFFGKTAVPRAVVGEIGRFPPVVAVAEEGRKRTYLIHAINFEFETLSVPGNGHVNVFLPVTGVHRLRVEGKGTR